MPPPSLPRRARSCALLARPACCSYSDRRATARWPTLAAPRAVDNEGNELATTGGRQYVSRLTSGIYPHAGTPWAAAVPPNPAATYAALKAQCVAVRDEQLATARSLRGDMKYWFAKVYHFVTRNDDPRPSSAGELLLPASRCLQEVLAFHATYRAQPRASGGPGHIGNVEENWRVAFREAEEVNDGSWYRTRAQEILSALLPSMQAHIRFDLPRAIASRRTNGTTPALPGTSPAVVPR